MNSAVTPAASHRSVSWRMALRRAGDSPWFFPVTLAATVVGLFLEALQPDRVFAFRDSLHFYPPLYRLVREEWLAGRVPLWNPLLNCGQPLAGMGTSGAFYVPQLVITMLLPDGVSLNAYCILHLAWAATGAYLLARHQGCFRPAATVAGLAYGFCGSVLLQIYNPIYAAGAAWLVWAVYGGVRLLQGGGVRDFLVLSASLAMAVYCGDPQTAYHAGMVLGLLWLMTPGRSWRGFGLLAAAGLAGGALSLVQIALAVQFGAESSRAMDVAPLSIWEVPGFFRLSPEARAGVRWYDALLGNAPASAGHYANMYSFSMVPSRFAELVWPSFSGTQFSRWLKVLGIDTSGGWVNSIYMGVVPLLSACAAVMTPVARRPRRFWAAVLALSFLASLGGYGVTGIARGIDALVTGDWTALAYRPGDEVGGVYWFLTVFVPGYAGFRYPAKWMTVFALAAAQLAGIGFESLAERSQGPGLRRAATTVAVVVGAMLGCLLIGAVIVGPENVLPGGAEPTRRFLLFRAVALGGVQAFAVVAATLWLAGSATAARHLGHAGCAVALVGLTAADITLAGRREIILGSYSSLVASGQYLETVARQRDDGHAPRNSRMRIVAWSPLGRFSDTQDPARFVAYTGAVMQGHVPWLHDCGKFAEFSTAMSADMVGLCEPRREAETTYMPRRTYDLAGVECFLVPLDGLKKANADRFLRSWSAEQAAGVFSSVEPVGTPLPLVPLFLPGEELEPPVALLARNPDAQPRARIVRRCLALPLVTKEQGAAWTARLAAIAFPSPAVPELTHTAVIESSDEGMADALRPWNGANSAPRHAGEDTCRITIDESQRVVVENDLSAAGILVLADTFHSDWSASITADGGPVRPLPIMRANRIHRACILPRGRSVVEFRYHSATFSTTRWLTLAGWLASGIALAVDMRRSRVIR